MRPVWPAVGVICLSIGLIPGVLGTARAADLSQGVAAYQRGDYAAALAELRPLAQGGNARAQFALARMYAAGDGVDQDQDEATRWYRSAAEQGLAQAQYNLGVRLQNGTGTTEQLPQAARWYARAAEQGHLTARNNLGLLYVLGRGVEKNRRRGIRLVMAAAHDGDAAARRNTAKLLENLEKLRVDGSRVNVRARPTTQAEIVLQTRNNTEVRVLGRRGDWTEVVFADNYLIGWIASFLLTAPP